MSRSTDATDAGAGRRGGARRLTGRRLTLGAAPAWAAAAAGAVLAGAPGRAAAQVVPPGPTTRPAPAPADTGQASRDSARAAARPDSTGRAAASDSTQRDSVIARQLRAAERAQAPVYRRFAPDRLRLTAVGASFGLAVPDQVKPAPVYAVSADYGELTPSVRALFGVTYWSSHVKDAAVAGLRRRVTPGPAPDSAAAGPIRSSDVALTADLRWRPVALRRLRLPLNVRPWLGGGAGVHLLDVQGAPITGTFVERALDGVSFGVAGALGADLTLLPNVQLTTQARYDLFSGAHFGSVRAGAFYILDRRGRP